MFFKKIDTISKMTVTQHNNHENGVINLCVNLEKNFSDIAKKKLKPVIEDLIVVIKNIIDDNTFLLATAFDYGSYVAGEDESVEFARHFTSQDPTVKYVSVCDIHIMLLFSEVKSQNFHLLKNLTFPNGEALNLDVFNTNFSFFKVQDINDMLPKIEKHIDDVEESYRVLSEKSQGDLIYLDRFSTRGIYISMDISHEQQILKSMVDVFKSHQIELEFILET